ncbi:unnamed protein product [Clavelina lepadiformis]|uniref:Cilia- and flagella-associated protein 70 n=1 Tax=Clavelina lepadiformis TaxID=159417 RepID=A0ABP0H174_CLALP
MAELETQRTSETILITISRAKKLRGSKGEILTSYAKVEFDGKSLGDSSKVESTGETNAEYNFTTSFDCSFMDGHLTLDDVASKPVLITIIEVLPKEKKQKEEKSAPLGQCTIDLLPLFHSNQPVNCSFELHPVVGATVEGGLDAPKPELDISMSVNEALIEQDQNLQSNLLTVRVGSAYSIPDPWSSSGSQYNYVVGLPVPVNADKDISVIFSNGLLRSAAEKEQYKRAIKWYSVPNAVSSSQYIPNSAHERVPFDEEKGDFATKEYAEFRRESEHDKNRITWDIEKRCYLQPEAKSLFQNKIAQTRLWPVEIMRMVPSQPKAAVAAAGSKKDKGASEEEGNLSYHGVAYVDLAPLLYPGVCTVSGAFRVLPYNEHEHAEKTKQKNTIAEDVARAQSSTSRVTGSSPVQKGKGAAARDHPVAPSKKGSATKQPESNVDVVDLHNVEAAAYVDCKTYLYLEFSLAHPLVPRREPEELANSVVEYIPSRPKMKRVVGGATKAVEDYHSQLSSVAVMVLDEFRQVCGNEVVDDPHKQGEAKKQLMYQLNSTGKYFAFKEQLKHSIVKIVREKYLKTTSFKSNDELQQFLTELYVYLVDEMHSNLQKVLSVGGQPQESIEPMVDSTQLKRFAQEAVVNEEYEMASKYYQERLANDDKSTEHWLDYGTFNLLIGNNTKAKECFMEAVALEQTHLEGLLLYGIMCTIDQSYKEAETMFERAVSLAENGSEFASMAWTVLALFYDSQGNEIRAEHSYLEANKLNLLAAVNKAKAELPAVATGKQPKDDTEQGESENEAEETDAGSVLKLRAVGSAKSVSTIKGSKAPTRKDTLRARSSAENSVTSFDVKHSNDPQSDNQHTMPTTETVNPESIFLQAARWLIDHKALKFAEIALSQELLTCNGSCNADYFILLSRLQLMRKQYKEALESLKSATSLDNEHPDAWAMMGHVYYISSDFTSAQDCYERTLAFINDASEMHSIYLRLASIYLQEEQFVKAKRTFLLACKYSPTCVSWLGVGTACYRLGEVSEAENALAEANILNNSNPDVWSYLSLVCLKTNRKLEAEQAYKYAVKLGLQDEQVFQEIRSLQKSLGFGNPNL